MYLPPAARNDSVLWYRGTETYVLGSESLQTAKTGST